MLNHLIHFFKTNFIPIIFPSFCRHCRAFLNGEEVFCNGCIKLIKPVASVDVMVTQTYSCPVWAISDYQEPLRSLILAKMYGDITAAVQLGNLLVEFTSVKHYEFDVVIPIPLHWQRYAKRGYNQAHEMAKVIAYQKKIICCQALKRMRATQYQAQLSVEERIANVGDVFTVDVRYHDLIINKRILLVDDLFTTGATIKSAIKVLKKLKPASITIAVACRVAHS